MAKFEARGCHVRLPAEIRAEGSGLRVEGYAAVFNEDADIAGLFIERIEPGAFAEAIGRDDVVFLVDHEGLPLARTRSGTLTLKEDARGLHMTTDLDGDDPDAARIVRKMRRGDMDKMSFAFFPEIEEWDDSGDIPVRTIRKAALRDVSIVTFPAYDGTEIALRSLQDHLATTRRQNNKHAQRLRSMRMNLGLKTREG